LSDNQGIHGKRIGERLIARGKLDQIKLARALAAQKASGSGERLGAILVKLDLVAERELYLTLSEQLGVPLLDASDYPQIPVLEERVSIRFLKQAHALPLHEDEHKLMLAMSDPLDDYTLKAFKLLTGREMSVVMAPPAEIDAVLEKLYTAGKGAMGQIVSNIEVTGNEEESSDVQHLNGQRGAGDPPGQPVDPPRGGSCVPRTSTSSRSRPPASCATASTACCTRSNRRRACPPP
jgi:general secretion pathway protein E